VTIQLYHGDCLDILPTLEDGSVDVVITDPPYGISYSSQGGPRVKDPNIVKRTQICGDIEFNPEWIVQTQRPLRLGSAIYVFCCWDSYTETVSAIVAAGLKNKTTLVWDKGNCGMGDLSGDYGNQTELVVFAHKGRHILNGNRDRNILSFQRPADVNRLHPTQKPIALIAWLIEKSTSMEAVVLDPFMGSGTTGVACVNTGRSFIGIEINKEYFDLAKNRIELAQPRLI